VLVGRRDDAVVVDDEIVGLREGQRARDGGAGGERDDLQLVAADLGDVGAGLRGHEARRVGAWERLLAPRSAAPRQVLTARVVAAPEAVVVSEHVARRTGGGGDLLPLERR
jgi:hypothetical protein